MTRSRRILLRSQEHYALFKLADELDDDELVDRAPRRSLVVPARPLKRVIINQDLAQEIEEQIG